MKELGAIVLYRCPECRALSFPTGEEQEHGPPECNHGLMFGTTPDGGGECEMCLVRYLPDGPAE